MNTESTSGIDQRAYVERDESSSQFSREPAAPALWTGMESNTSTSTNTTKNHRARWAAIGAAVAVSLGAGGIGLVQATSPEGASAYVPITPCRLADTRPAPDNVGPRATPLGAAETHTFNGWASAGGTGNCDATALPDGTTGLELNVTAVGPTQNTNLRFWPADETMPLASNLNPSVGQPATPNSVSVTLSPTGQFNAFNFQGSVNVVIDVVGHYTDHNHDDRYYTEEELDARLPIAQAHLGLTGGSTNVDIAGTPGLTATYDLASDYIEVSLDGVSLDETTHVVHVTPERVNFGAATEDRSATTFFTGGTVRVAVWDADANAGAGGPVINDVHITIWAL